MYGLRFDEALGFASRLHREQVRKGTTIPYLLEPLRSTVRKLEALASRP
jgi:hypothetical protein